jgi:hypothetical protein
VIPAGAVIQARVVLSNHPVYALAKLSGEISVTPRSLT